MGFPESGKQVCTTEGVLNRGWECCLWRGTMPLQVYEVVALLQLLLLGCFGTTKVCTHQHKPPFMLCISTPNSVRPHLQLYKVVALLQLLPQPLRHKLRRQQLLRRRTHVVAPFVAAAVVLAGCFLVLLIFLLLLLLLLLLALAFALLLALLLSRLLLLLLAC